MWQEIKFLEFVEYRKHYNVLVRGGSLSGDGDFGEYGAVKHNSRIRWESDSLGTRWYKWANRRGEKNDILRDYRGIQG